MQMMHHALDWDPPEGNQEKGPFFHKSPDFISTSNDGRQVLIGNKWRQYRFDLTRPGEGWQALSQLGAGVTSGAVCADGSCWLLNRDLILRIGRDGAIRDIFAGRADSLIWGDDAWYVTLSPKKRDRMVELRYHDLERDRRSVCSVRGPVYDLWKKGDSLRLLCHAGGKRLRLCRWLPPCDRLVTLDEIHFKKGAELGVYIHSFEYAKYGHHAHGWPHGEEGRAIQLLPHAVLIDGQDRITPVGLRLMWHPVLTDPANLEMRERLLRATAGVLANQGIDPTRPFWDTRPFLIATVEGEEGQAHVVTTLGHTVVPATETDDWNGVDAFDRIHDLDLLQIIFAECEGDLPPSEGLASLCYRMITKRGWRPLLGRKTGKAVGMLSTVIEKELRQSGTGTGAASGPERVTGFRSVFKAAACCDGEARDRLLHPLEPLVDEFPEAYVPLSLAYHSLPRRKRPPLPGKLRKGLREPSRILAETDDHKLCDWIIRRGARLGLSPEEVRPVLEEYPRLTPAAWTYSRRLVKRGAPVEALHQAMCAGFLRLASSDPEAAVQLLDDGFLPETADDRELPREHRRFLRLFAADVSREEMAALLLWWQLETRPWPGLTLMAKALNVLSACERAEPWHLLLALTGFLLGGRPFDALPEKPDPAAEAFFELSDIRASHMAADRASAIWERFAPAAGTLRWYLAAGIAIAACAWLRLECDSDAALMARAGSAGMSRSLAILKNSDSALIRTRREILSVVRDTDPPRAEDRLLKGQVLSRIEKPGRAGG